MYRHVYPRIASHILLLFLLLFGLAAQAARLEVDRTEIAVGEITTVHLKGAPLIAVVTWQVSPELEIIESDKKRARVRGVRAGVGKVSCDMNLSTHILELSVHAGGTPAASSTPALIQPVQPAMTGRDTTFAEQKTSSLPATQERLQGIWQINAAGYSGKLELASASGALSGRVWFDAHGTWEPLAELYFDASIGELSFSRPNANQAYRGRLNGDRLEGYFTQWGGRDYTASPARYPWTAQLAGAPVASAVAGRPWRIVDFSWRGMDADKVGDWGNGRPNGTADGHFTLTLDLPERTPISSISLWSATEKGDRAGGQVWHSREGSYWMLGIFRDGRQLNATHVQSLGEFSGKVVLELYANSSGWFNPGQSFLLEVAGADGRLLSQTLKLEKVTAEAQGLLAYLSMDGQLIEKISGRPANNQGARVTSDRNGHAGGALLFDGRAHVEIDVDINPAKRPQLTLAAWVRADSEQPIQQLASHDNGGFDRSLGIDYRGGGSGWSAFAGSAGVLGVKPVQVGKWTFVAATWDQTARSVRLYVDDARFDTSGTCGGGHGKLRIGMNPGFGEHFKGAIDEFWVFDRVLSPEEIGKLRGLGPVTGASSSLTGTWNINANGYGGRLQFSDTEGRLAGRVWFDAHQVWEDLRDITFDGQTLRFLRPGPSQRYVGKLSGNDVRGQFDQGGSGAWNWQMSRVSTAPEARIDQFVWLGMDEDRVGDWGNGRANGTPDGRFRLVVDLPERQAISSISVWSATERGDKAGGQVWHSRLGQYWMLGVFRDDRQLNASHTNSLGDHSGQVVFDLFANSSGWFNPGQTFLVELETADGKIIGRTVSVAALAASARGHPSDRSGQTSEDSSVKGMWNELKGLFGR